MTPAPVAEPTAELGEVRFAVWGGTAVAVVTDPEGVGRAEALLREELAEFDRVCSRFRADSEIRLLTRRAGAPVQLSPLLAEVLGVALRAAELTDGLVDPTVGRALAELGYDRDFAELPPDRPAVPLSPAPGWWRLRWDSSNRTLVLPRGVELDVGATAKALAADRAAARIAAELGGGALVSLAGDVSAAGQPPPGGWLIAVGDDHDNPDPDSDDGPTVAITAGGLATSGTTRRRWRSGGQVRHHIVDPRTGESAPQVWRTVSVAAGSCVDANTASTAAVVLGLAAAAWLAGLGLPARLVAATGEVETVAGWPDETRTEVAG
jgi:thiamine biosynthesis lipoprotein